MKKGRWIINTGGSGEQAVASGANTATNPGSGDARCGLKKRIPKDSFVEA